MSPTFHMRVGFPANLSVSGAPWVHHYATTQILRFIPSRKGFDFLGYPHTIAQIAQLARLSAHMEKGIILPGMGKAHDYLLASSAA